MAIHGALGFRMVEWEPSRKRWVSPSYRNFVWTGQIVWATCDECPKDEDGHILMRRVCTCGIHATHWNDEFVTYCFNANAVGLLVEALGTYWAHTYGFTAPGVQVARVVNITKFGQEFGVWPEDQEGYKRTLSVQQITMQAARRFFTPNHDIVDFQTAREAAKAQWERLGMEWLVPDGK